MIYINNTEICTPSEIIKQSHLIIEGSKIKRVLRSLPKKIPPKTKVINGRGKIVCPGFIDVHLQGAGGHDFLDGTPEAIRRISQTLARFGTTSYLATTVFKNGKNPHIENIVECQNASMSRCQSKGAQCLGIHLEGPFVNPKRKGMIRPDGIKGCSSAYLDKILNVSGGRLKMMTIAPELKDALRVIRRLRARRVIASLGHSDADYEQAQKGIRAGINHVTHVFNAMRPLHHREPAGLGAVLMDGRVSIQLIADGVHIHPAVIRLIVKLKEIKNIILITDSMSSQGLPDGKYVYDGWEYTSKAGACRYKDGTLIGTALPLNRMVRRFMKFGRVGFKEAVQAATINPARVLGIHGRKGSIEEGKDADIVMMDNDFNVTMTIVGGEIVYRKGERS